VSRRVSLPGAEELFRRTAPEESEPLPASESDDISTALQVAKSTAVTAGRRPKHDEKITFYCTADDVMSIERARLALRGEHGVSADRGRIVRAALGYVLEDFAARGEDAILVRELRAKR
jgi:hypothetical protein